MKHEEKAREITEYVMIDPIVRVGSGELEHVIAAALREAYEQGVEDAAKETERLSGRMSMDYFPVRVGAMISKAIRELKTP